MPRIVIAVGTALVAVTSINFALGDRLSHEERIPTLVAIAAALFFMVLRDWIIGILLKRGFDGFQALTLSLILPIVAVLAVGLLWRLGLFP